MNILTRFQRWVGGGMVPRNYCRVTFGGIERFAKYSRHTLLRLQKEHPNNTIAIYRNSMVQSSLYDIATSFIVIHRLQFAIA